MLSGESSVFFITIDVSILSGFEKQSLKQSPHLKIQPSIDLQSRKIRDKKAETEKHIKVEMC